MLISPVSEEEMVRSRNTDFKSKRPKQDDKIIAVQENGNVGKTEQKDHLLEKDPWADWMGDTKRARPLTSSAASSTTPSSKATTLETDPRLSSLAMRMERIEKAHEGLEAKVDRVDGQLGTMSEQMNEQFKQVMVNLQNLQKLKSDAQGS